MNNTEELEQYKRALERERLARKEAEKIVELKSVELYASNLALIELNKQLEQQVKERTNEVMILARMPEEIPDPVMRISRFGIVTYTNQACKQYWGPILKIQEGEPYPLIFQEDIDKSILGHTSHVAEYTFEKRSWSVQFNAVEQYGYIHIMARDITQQKRSEEKIRKSQEALLEAQELGNLGRWEFNMLDSTFIWSPQLFRQYGIPIAEQAPAGGDFFQFIHQEDLSIAQNGINKALTEGFAQFEQRIIRPDGSIRNLYTTVKAEHAAKGEPSRIYGTSLDVTELRQAEAQLRKSEERFQLALQGMNDGLWDWDLQNGTVYLSPQWKSLLGYQDHELENNWETFSGFLQKDDLDRLMDLIENSPPEANHKLSYEFRIKHRDGKWRHMMARCIVLHNQNGEKIRLVGANTDLTQRITAEKKLINSLDQMKILSRISFMFNSVSEDFEKPVEKAIEIIGRHSGVSRVYIFENSSDGVFASNTFEWCREGILPLIDELQNVPYSTLQTFRKSLKKHGIIAADIKSLPPALLRALMRQQVKSLMIMPLFVQDELAGFVGFDDCEQQREWESADVELLKTFSNLLSNIFERQQAEYKVLKSEEKYRSLVDNLTEIIFQTDQQSKLTFLNPIWQEITGYTPEESLGNSLDRYIVQEDQTEYFALEKLLYEHKTDFCRQIMRIQAKDGSIRHVELFARLLDGQWGETQGMSGTLTDVTEQQLTEISLIKAKEEAEKASLAKAQFLSVMSHEIRTPLNAMLGIAHLLIRQQPRSDQEENLKLLKFSGENLLSLINDILDFNKIESGKIVIEKTQFDLKKLCHGLHKSLSLKADEKNIALELVLDPATPGQVVGDPTRLTQILNNLLDNAVKFTHEGIVKLALKVLKKNQHDATIEFTVSDTGIGISGDAQSKIFEAFTQVHQTNNYQYGGTGLGLSIIKRLLDLLGSKIEVSSQPGQGSEFRFILNFEVAPEQTTLHAEAEAFLPAAQSLENTSLLLVEDNPLNMLVLVQFFEIWGLQPDVAENGLQALARIQEKAYDLVLMDLHMPEMDGIETTNQIRHKLNLKDLPIIALTANALPGIRQKVMAAGMNDYISKPFEPEDLFQKVLRYAPKAQKVTLPKGTPEPTKKTEKVEPLYSLQKLYHQSNNNPVFVTRMAELFIKTCRQQLALMQQKIEERNTTAVQDIAHKLKPSVDLFDIKSQYLPVRRLELITSAELQSAAGSELAENFISCLQEVVLALQEWFEQQRLLRDKD
ncbi:MAG: PAS domain S-box protein [Bacteroidetes bacterium]|nr:PAS domain S-box protein [Bacteroidota bacterium]